ncbi:MAG: ATP-binding protein [Gammaproteobacteria bacterium]|nr:ATP-binding protein [Gammaproteobacteria bacterium]
MKGLMAQAEVTPNPAISLDESAWIEVIQRMDQIYADLVNHQVELEQKNTSLENAQRFISSVISSMSDVLIVADIRGKIQQVNHSLESLIGQSAKELKGQPLASLFMPDYAEQVEDFAEHIREHTVTDCEVELRTQHQHGVPIAINCTPRFEQKGRLSGLVITGRPLGELRHAYQELKNTHKQLRTTQHQLVQSEKMASLGQLVSGVAHELNNPISFVFGNMHALRRYEQRLSEYLAAIHANNTCQQHQELRERLRIDPLLRDIGSLIDGSLEGAERVREIVEELRRFSTPNQQQAQYFNLIAVIRTTADWVIKAQRKSPQLNIDADETVEIYGYKGYLHQVLINLLQNATDAVQQSDTPRIDIQLTQHAEHAVIEIHDHGDGISETHLLRIFDPFFTTKEVGQGTGLGLYISYNLATEQCQGQLQAENHPNGGALFRLTLPLQVAP